MAYIFTQVHADIAPELRELCFKHFPVTSTDFGSTTAIFSALLTNICKLTGANFVDGVNPKLLGSWHSVRDSYDLLTSLVLQQNIQSFLHAKEISMTNKSFPSEHSVQNQEAKQMTKSDRSESEQNATQAMYQLYNDRMDPYNPVPNKFPPTPISEKMETVSVSRSEHDHLQLSNCDQSAPSSARRNVVIDFQDVNFESLQNFDHDQQQESLESMHVSNAHTTIEIKQEYGDEAYQTSSEPQSSNNISMTGHIQESPEQPQMFMMQNEGLSMHMKLEDCDRGGTSSNFGTKDLENENAFTVSPMVTTEAQEVPAVCGQGKRKKNRFKKSGSLHTQAGIDTKGTKMFFKETNEHGSSFVCGNCDYSTYCLKNIEDHVRRNHSERLYHCSMCSTKFGLKRDLKRHYKVKHYVIIDSNQKQNILQKQ